MFKGLEELLGKRLASVSLTSQFYAITVYLQNVFAMVLFRIQPSNGTCGDL